MQRLGLATPSLFEKKVLAKVRHYMNIVSVHSNHDANRRLSTYLRYGYRTNLSKKTMVPSIESSSILGHDDLRIHGEGDRVQGWQDFDGDLWSFRLFQYVLVIDKSDIMSLPIFKKRGNWLMIMVCAFIWTVPAYLMQLWT